MRDVDIAKMSCLQDRAVCVPVLESLGFRVGQGLIERYRLHLHPQRRSPPLKSQSETKFALQDDKRLSQLQR